MSETLLRRAAAYSVTELVRITLFGKEESMAPSKVETLLSELCVELGFCLPSREITRLKESPPSDVDAFTKAVFDAEGVDVGHNRRLWKQVREKVGQHFAASK